MAAPSLRPMAAIKQLVRFAWSRYRSLNFLGKLFVWLVILFYICMGTFILIVTPARIAQYSYDKARILAATPFGWLVLGTAIVCISFPPLVGHTTLVTLCGFAYGLKGFFIAATASVLGSALVFTVLRLLFSEKLRNWSTQNQKWQALESVVVSFITLIGFAASPTNPQPSPQKEKGLPLVILIRISPFPPWGYSNSLFASIEAVKLWQFIIATFFIFPKLLLHTFIGSKIAALSDGDQRGHMDTRTKVFNGFLVGGGMVVAILTSWWVYTLVQNHIRHLDGFPPEVDELAAEAIENYDEEAPLLSPSGPNDG